MRLSPTGTQHRSYGCVYIGLDCRDRDRVHRWQIPPLSSRQAA
ncbi:MAG: hypothetical protein AAFY57_06370 [Cyanobacteria bacterium J06642_2]